MESVQAKAAAPAGIVAKGSAIMMVALLMSRVLGQLRDTVISAQFGLNAATDVYRSAFALPDLLFFLIAGGALSSAFIPVFSEYLSKGEEVEAWRVFSIVGTVMAIVIAGMVVLCEIFAGPLVRALRPGLTDLQLQQTALLTRIVLPSQIAFFLGGLMFSTLYTRHHFLIPALGPNVYNLGIIVGGLLLNYFAGAGLAGFAIGALVGALVGNLFMPLYALERVGIKYRWNLDLRHPGVRQVGRLMLPVILGLSLPGVYGLINGWYASYLRPGSISALDQANRLMQAPLGIFGQALAIAAFPTLSLLAASNHLERYRETLNRSLRAVLFLTVPISTAMIVFAPDIVRLLFQYGKFKSNLPVSVGGWSIGTLLAYGGDPTAMTSLALVCYCVGIFGWSALALLHRGFYALKNTRTPILIGTATTAVFIPLSYALQATPLQHAGLALATSIAAVGQMIWMFGALSRRVHGIGLRALARSAALTTVASVSSAVVAALSRTLLVPAVAGSVGDARLGSIALVTIAGGVGAGAFFLAARLLRMDELQTALGMLRKRRSRST